jgi:hypothetical protein
MSKPKLRILLIILIAGLASAQVYKWVDEEGGVHFGDRPPESAEPEEMILPRGPSEEEVQAAQEQVRQAAESRRQSTQGGVAGAVEAVDGEDRQAVEGQRDRQCVEALYQLELLKDASRVFRMRPDGSRVYLDDASLPREIERLESLKTENCSTDKAVASDQVERAGQLAMSLGPRCAVMHDALRLMEADTSAPDAGLEQLREQFADECPDVEAEGLYCAILRGSLRSMEDPESRTSPAELEKQRRLVDSECPHPATDGLWIRDFLYRSKEGPESAPPAPPDVPPPPIEVHILPKKGGGGE